MATETLNVELPSGVVYVSGTVNGISKTWTNTEGNIWQTTADKADDDKYTLVMTMINAVGTTSVETITLYYGALHLITDRTQADVDRVAALAAKLYDNMSAAEKAEWNGEMKGAYNVSDLNRVESAVKYLANLLVSLDTTLKDYAASEGVAWDNYFDLPYSISTYSGITTKTTWAESDFPTLSQMSRYLSNVKTLTAALSASYPALPSSMTDLTYAGANAIERALEVVGSAILAMRESKEHEIDNTAASFVYSGEFYTNEV